MNKRAKQASWFNTISTTEPRASKRSKPTSMKDITHHAQDAAVHDLIATRKPPKTAFQLDWERRFLRCPNQQEMPFVPGGVVKFPAETCQACPLRQRCTTSRNA